MTMDEEIRLKTLRFAGSALFSVYKGILYFLSFVGPVLILYHFRFVHIAFLLALGILAWGGAGVLFLWLIVLTKKFLIGSFQATGVETIHTSNGKRWLSAALLTSILVGSPFRSMTSGLSLFASWYYRGMGATMPESTFLGVGTRISDPWFLEIGENVNIGGEAVILGHVGHGKEIILGRVLIGHGAVVGMRSVIFPDVRIGNHSIVGAGAVVVRGTIIPDGETWAGVPARKVSARPNTNV